MTEVESAPPKLFEHVCRVFEAMRREAKPALIAAQHALVYEGHTTKLFRDLGLATPYYTSVLQRLQSMGCIKQLSRGGGSATSRWELLKDPEFGDFEQAAGAKQKNRLTVVESQVNTMDERLEAVEEALGLRETGT